MLKKIIIYNKIGICNYAENDLNAIIKLIKYGQKSKIKY